MLFERLSAAFAAAAAAVLAPSARAQAESDYLTFVNDDGGIAFGLTFPDGADDQFYFSLRAHRSHAWGAIGLGADSMPGALYLMVYDNRDQTNITFSPRLSYGHHEPEFYPDMEYRLLDGTGIYDQHMMVRGHCLRNCLTWPARGTEGGKIDAASSREKAMYALGPLAGFASDNPRESLQFHVQYGSFYMDTSRAHGGTEPPVLARTTRSDGAVINKKSVRQADIMSTIHAVCMILAFVLLMPLGAAMLRLGPWVKWHAVTQTTAMAIVFIGLGLGVSISRRYRRSWNFDSYHQILGIIVLIFVVMQLGLGLYNHRHYLRTQRPSVLGKVHLWNGRLILFLGIMNGFFGFTFALNRRYAIVLGALIIAMCLAIFLTIVGRRWLTKRRLSRSSRLRSAEGSPYNRPPIVVPDQRGQWGPQGNWQPFYAYPAAPPPQYHPPQRNIGLEHAMGPVSGSAGPHGPINQPPRAQWHSGPQAPRELI